MPTTIREANLVYDIVRNLSTQVGTFQTTATELLRILTPVVAPFRTNLKDALVIKHGERSGDLDKFVLKKKEQVLAYQSEVKSILDTVIDLKLKADQQQLFNGILLQKLAFFIGDFPLIP